MPLYPPTTSTLKKVVALLKNGGICALPTETVYGLAASAFHSAGVGKIFALKGRPLHKPLIVHIASPDILSSFAHLPPHLKETVQSLIDAFWPGALTLVLPLKKQTPLSPLVTGGLKTVAVRLPAHKIMQRCLHLLGAPIAAPSANPYGFLSPTRPAHVLKTLPQERAEDTEGLLIVEDNTSPCGVESTIFCPHRLKILRPGSISSEEIASVLNKTISTLSATSKSALPGGECRHYQPAFSLVLNVQRPPSVMKASEVFVGFGPCHQTEYNFSKKGCLKEAAANFFSLLHALEDAGTTKAYIVPIPQEGLGITLNDRLRRASV